MAVWNNGFEATPAGSEDPSLGDDRFRELKLAVRERLQKEHTMNLSSGIAGEDGWHKGGTAKVYLQGTAPTLRPDGLTALNAEDNGRIWIDTGTFRIRVYKHDAGATTAERWVLQDDLLPVGEILLWPGENATIPTGWMRCAGTAISRADYSVLHTIMKDVGGTNAYGWGSGDGSTTFNLPNLANPMPRGAGYIIKVRSIDPNATVESGALDARIAALEALVPTGNVSHGFVEYLGATNVNWVAPVGVTEVVLNGVGRGGNGAAGAINRSGGGGGSGAWCRSLRKTVVPGQSYNIVLSTSGNSTFFGVTLGKGGDASAATAGAAGTGAGGASNGFAGGAGFAAASPGAGGGGIGGVGRRSAGGGTTDGPAHTYGGGSASDASSEGPGSAYGGVLGGSGGAPGGFRFSIYVDATAGGIGGGGGGGLQSQTSPSVRNGAPGGPGGGGGGGCGESNGSGSGGTGGPPFLRIDW